MHVAGVRMDPKSLLIALGSRCTENVERVFVTSSQEQTTTRGQKSGVSDAPPMTQGNNNEQHDGEDQPYQYEGPQYHYKYQEDEVEEEEASISDKVTPITLSPKDLLVHVHLQKSGGKTFNSVLESGAKEGKSSCLSPSFFQGSTWLLSRSTTKWRCGVHPSYTRWNQCLSTKFGNRNPLWITQVRHPVERFWHEYLETQGTFQLWHVFWPTDCGGKVIDTRPPDPRKYERGRDPPFQGNLEDFKSWASHETNAGRNRQTIMLSTLVPSLCEGGLQLGNPEHERLILEDAKRVLLEELHVVGIYEAPTELWQMLRHKFPQLCFEAFPEFVSQQKVPEEVVEMIKEINHLDIELWEFARDLFWRRHNATFGGEEHP
ncbi:Sulfotransferase [Balamuthia mandrillaris]